MGFRMNSRTNVRMNARVSLRYRVVNVATLLGVLLSAMVLPLDAQTPAATPAAGARGAAATAAPASAAPVVAQPAGYHPSRDSWTADRRSFAVGDIITVLIDDYTISTAVKENTATDTRTRDLSLTAQLPASSKSGGLTTRNNADQQQRGSARRENRFQNEMSVRVVAISPNGLLQLKGTKKIDVDQAQQDLVFSGWVRKEDVSSQNVVESNRVADQTLGYLSPGPLGKPKSGIITKVLGALWP
jgi:flagellar L-ring protein precursor FlgH